MMHILLSKTVILYMIHMVYRLYEKEFQYPGPYKEASEEQQLIKKQRPKVTDHGVSNSWRRRHLKILSDFALR